MPSVSARARRDSFENGQKRAEFSHDLQQLVVVSSGLAALQIKSGIWLVPAGFGVLIPRRIRHAWEFSGDSGVTTIYLGRDISDRCRVFHASPLLRAIVDRIATASFASKSASAQRLVNVLIDQLADERDVPLFVPMITDERGQRAVDVLVADPSDTPTAKDVASELGMSTRTLGRRFQQSAGTSPGRWRSQMRLARALALLAGGAAVKDVALEVGYETPSAFVAKFRKTLGVTPGKVFRASGYRLQASAAPDLRPKSLSDRGPKPP